MLPWGKDPKARPEHDLKNLLLGKPFEQGCKIFVFTLAIIHLDTSFAFDSISLTKQQEEKLTLAITVCAASYGPLGRLLGAFSLYIGV